MLEENETTQNQSEKIINLPQTNAEDLPEVDESIPNAGGEQCEASAVETQEEEFGSQSLDEALQKFNINLSPKKVRLLDEYCDLLWTWNEKLNLTRHTTYDKFVSRDLVDSIRLAALFQKGEHVLDVGSGGGAPGLIVAILRPDVVVELCEATGKKAVALGKMLDDLKLDNKVWYSKAQDLVHERHFHTLTVRAVDRMCNLLTMFRSSWNSFNRILMIKGPRWVDERGEARHYNLLNSLALRKIDEYQVSGAGEVFTSVILQVCPKKKLEEIKLRATELAEGKPYPGGAEEIILANSSSLDSDQRSKAPGSRRFNSKRKSSYITTKNNRSDSNATQTETRVYARRNGKPPRGWTGKKGEFRAESNSNDSRDNRSNTENRLRSNKKKASDSSKRNKQDGSASRKNRPS